MDLILKIEIQKEPALLWVIGQLGLPKLQTLMLLSPAHTTGCLPGSLCMRWAGSLSSITSSCTGDSAKTDVLRKLMNEKRAGGLLSGGKLGLTERRVPESSSSAHVRATTDFLLLYADDRL